MRHWQMRIEIAKGNEEEEVQKALKQWFIKVRKKEVRVTGPPLCRKAEGGSRGKNCTKMILW